MINPNQPLLPSVLDRLLDERPDQKQDQERSRSQNLAALRGAIRRDLEALMNTRRRCISPPPGLQELDVSLVEYGIPDVLSASAGSDEVREGLRHSIENVIRRFEPRFKSVTVNLLGDNAQNERTLRFRIDALVYAEPAPEFVSFDSLLDTATSNFSVTGRRDG